MVLVSYAGKEINAKLVYYGPGLSGKTTNLEYIYGSIPGDNRGKMVSMKTKTERTLFFDFLPVQLGELSGFKTRFLLYTVPGQVYYNATRKLVLKGVDAVVFVADSKRGKMDENVESLENLKENLREHGLTLEEVPFVLQYNKRDLPDVYTVDEMNKVLNPHGVPAYEAVAAEGPGVVDTFKAVSRLLLKKLSGEIGVPVSPVAPEPKAAAAPEAASSAPPASSGAFTGGGGGAQTDPNLTGAVPIAAAPKPAAPIVKAPIAATNAPTSGASPIRPESHVSPPIETSPPAQMPVSQSRDLPLISQPTEPPRAQSEGVETPGTLGGDAGSGLKALSGMDPQTGSVKQRLSRWLRRSESDTEERRSGFFPDASESATANPSAFTETPAATPRISEPEPVASAAAESVPVAPTPLEVPMAVETTLNAPEAGERTASATPQAGNGPREIVIPVRLDLRPEDLETGIVVKLNIQLSDDASAGGQLAA